MNATEYQRLAARTEKPLPVEGRLQHAMLGITSEAGELADTVKKHVIYGQPLKVVGEASITEEIGDLLWYAALLANATGICLETCMDLNIEKLAARYPERFTEFHAAKRLDKA